jgi:hypothetical protein
MTADLRNTLTQAEYDMLMDRKPLMAVTTDSAGIRLIEGLNGTILYWTDHVANEWIEEYDELQTALARFALLMEGIEREQWFRHADPADFAQAWSDRTDMFLQD